MKNFFGRLRRRLTRLYRISFIDNETLFQTRQYLVRPLTILFYCLLFLGITIGGTTAAIFYIPFLRESVPNYKELITSQDEIIHMEKEIASLNQENEKMDSLFSAVKEMLGGEGIGFEEEDDASITPADMGRPNVQPFASPKMISEATPSDDPGNVRIVYVSDQGRGKTPGRQRLNFFVPVRGELRRKFNMEEKHYGVDIVAAKEELVLAATDGFVVLAEYSDKDGHVLGVAHPDNIITFYKHNSRLLKKVGSAVVAGEPIAVIGNSGENSTGPHLHFEVWDRGHPVDPMDYYAGFE
jgi:murein DD-endopeptidase MepM/ murein hydrolase activator NlpD